MTHEDDRRVLIDWPEAKIVTAKVGPCILGNHYHKIKTERFILVNGEAAMVLDGSSEKMEIGKIYDVLPPQLHTFILTKGSVLVGLCSHAYTPSDDYK